MENELSFIPNYKHTASCFALGETFNQLESMIFSSLQCNRLCVNFHVGTSRIHIRYLSEFEFPARIPDESRLKC